MSYGWTIKSPVWDNNSIPMSYGGVIKSSVWNNNSTSMSSSGGHKWSVRDNGILLLSHTDELVSHPCDLLTIHWCHADEILSYPYDNSVPMHYLTDESPVMLTRSALLWLTVAGQPRGTTPSHMEHSRFPSLQCYNDRFRLMSKI